MCVHTCKSVYVLVCAGVLGGPDVVRSPGAEAGVSGGLGS